MRPCLPRPRLLAALIAGSLVATAGAAASQGPWEPTATGLSGEVIASGPRVALAADGAATAVWLASDGAHYRVQASTRPAGGAFDQPANLSAAGEHATAAQVAIGADGTTTVVWSRSNGTNTIVQAAVRPPGGAFGAPADLSAGGEDASNPQVAAAADGTTTVVWSRESGADTIVQAATRPPDGTFGAPVDLSETGHVGYFPQVAMASDGTTTVVWSGAGDGAKAVIRAPGGAFGAVQDLSAPGQYANDIGLAVAPGGATAVAWYRWNGAGHDIVQAVTREPGDAFSAPANLSPSDEDGHFPAVAVGTDGTATVIWRAHDTGGWDVRARTRPPGDDFAGAVTISASAAYTSALGVRTAADGTTTAIWESSEEDGWVVRAATRAPGAGFATAVALSAPGQDGRSPRVALAADGNATAVWQYGPWGAASVQALRTGNAPVGVTAPAITGSPAVGAQLTCDSGDWTGADAVTVTWLRDGLVTGTGAAHVVVSGDQGHALTCRATATNVFGTAEQASAPVSVSGSGPVLVAPPVVSGDGAVGAVLECDGGTWTGATAITVSWLRDGQAVGSGPSHTVTSADAGHDLRCRATAANAFGSAQALSPVVSVAPPATPEGPGPAAPADPAPSAETVPAPALPAPTLLAPALTAPRPKATGTPRAGRALRCRFAAPRAGVTVAVRWLRGRTAIPRARGRTYRVTRRDRGRKIACRVTVSAGAGKASATSRARAVRR